MYDELIKSLRVCASSGLPDSCLECPRFENGCDTLREDAADAIEVLSKTEKTTDELQADVRPVRRGKWIKYAPHNSDMMTCSECEKYWILDGDQYDYHFCPNCGADMREKTDEVQDQI